jgi:hypothetical protein
MRLIEKTLSEAGADRGRIPAKDFAARWTFPGVEVLK